MTTPDRTMIYPDDGDKDGGGGSGSGGAGAAEELPEIPGVKLDGRLGEGGMGAVYLGKQKRLDRPVAVKTIRRDVANAEFIGRFERESRILARLQHPNVVTCYDAGLTESGECYLIMELIEGPDLATYLEREGAMKTKNALIVGLGVARALEYGLSKGYIHRDIKPGNILMLPRTGSLAGLFPYEPKVADLGLAKQVEGGFDSEFATIPGAIMGSPGTMAPEQIAEPEAVDHRADIFALGCVIIHCLTGEPAFKRSSVSDIIRPTKCPDFSELGLELDPKLEALLLRMVAHDYSDRPGTHGEVIEELESLIGISSPPVKQVKLLVPTIGAIVVAIFIVAGVVLLGGAPDAEEFELAGRERVPISIDLPEDLQIEAPAWFLSDTVADLGTELGRGRSVEWVPSEAKAPYEKVLTLVDTGAGSALRKVQIHRLKIEATDDPLEISLVEPQSIEEGSAVSIAVSVTDYEQDAERFFVSITSTEHTEIFDGELPLAADWTPWEHHAPYTAEVRVIAESGGGETLEEVRQRWPVAADDDAPSMTLLVGSRELAVVDSAPIEVREGAARIQVEVIDPEGDPVNVTWWEDGKQVATGNEFVLTGDRQPLAERTMNLTVRAEDLSGKFTKRDVSIICRAGEAHASLAPGSEIDLCRNEEGEADARWSLVGGSWENARSYGPDPGLSAFYRRPGDEPGPAAMVGTFDELPCGDWRLDIDLSPSAALGADQFERGGCSIEWADGESVCIWISPGDEAWVLHIGTREGGASDGEYTSLASVLLADVLIDQPVSITIDYRAEKSEIAVAGMLGEANLEFDQNVVSLDAERQWRPRLGLFLELEDPEGGLSLGGMNWYQVRLGTVP